MAYTDDLKLLAYYTSSATEMLLWNQSKSTIIFHPWLMLFGKEKNSNCISSLQNSNLTAHLSFALQMAQKMRTTALNIPKVSMLTSVLLHEGILLLHSQTCYWQSNNCPKWLVPFVFLNPWNSSVTHPNVFRQFTAGIWEKQWHINPVSFNLSSF